MGRRGIRFLAFWPHQLSLRVGATVAACVGAGQLIAILVAAYFDQSLWLPGPDVGLLEHPGMLAIVVGDILLFVVCIQASQMTFKMGRKLPSRNRALVRRYYRRFVTERAFGKGRIFYSIFLSLAFVGVMALVNQSVRLFDPQSYYGHDTFDSVRHPLSFWTNRVNLFTSWCVIIPLFSSYLFVHSIAVRQLFRKMTARGIATFESNHPDRCGGYSYFGWLDTVYLAGLALVLIEVTMLMVTHRRVTLGNLSAVVLVTVGVVVISLFSIYEIVRTVKHQERALKTSSFSRRRHKPSRLSVEYVTLMYGMHFSPYTTTALKVAVGLRLAVAVPAFYRLAQFVSGAP